MYKYIAYGLKIDSTLFIPEFVESIHKQADVFIEIENDSYVEAADVQGRPWHLAMAFNEASLFCRNVAHYSIRRGKFISISPAPNADETLLRLFLIGNALAVLLFQRGYLILHASAVALDGSVVAFLGQTGKGKSTTAAAFHKAGYQLISDDVLAVNLNTNPVTVVPAFPKMKLHQEVISSMSFNKDAIKMIHPRLEKQGLEVSNAFSTEALPIERVFLLGESDSPLIKLVSPSEAIIGLLSNSYVTQKTNNASHLKQCANMAERVPVFYLKRPLSLELLPQIVNLIKQHEFN